MNEEQKKLYNEWRRLEEATTPTVRMLGRDGSYGPAKVIHLEDIEKLGTTREQVWKELRSFLDPSERFELGQRLEKTAKEIFSRD